MTASPKAWPECSSSATGWRRLDRSGSRRADPHAPGATGPVPQRRKRPLRSRRPTLCLARRAQQECQPQRAAHRRTDGLDSALQRGRLDPRGQPPRSREPDLGVRFAESVRLHVRPRRRCAVDRRQRSRGSRRVLRMDAGENAGWPFVRGLPTNPIERVAAAVIGDRFRSAVWESYDTRVAPTRSSSCAIMRMAPRWTGDFSSASTIRDASCSSSSTRPGRGSRAPARSWRALGRHHRPRARSGRTPVSYGDPSVPRRSRRSSSPTAPGGGDSRRHGEPAAGIEWARTVEDQRATADRRSIQP